MGGKLCTTLNSNNYGMIGGRIYWGRKKWPSIISVRCVYRKYTTLIDKKH